MFARLAEAATSLDIGTLFVIATCVTTLLGLFLLFAWMQDRIDALAWWGMAYLIGGLSGTLWQLEGIISPPVPPGLPNLMLFVALGMIWTAARLFHGREVLWGAMCFGAVVWLAASLLPFAPQTPGSRIMLSSTIVGIYTFLIAVELWRERRKSLRRCWPTLFVPMLHGAIFLFPVALASLGLRSLSTGWVAVFAIQVVLYVVGAAFIVLVLAKDRTVRRYKAAAETDPLTGLHNRRGFFEGASTLIAGHRGKTSPVSVIVFDLDHFKSINDRFGHDTGDAMLGLFARVIRRTMRADDIIGRLGGEEFVAILCGTPAEAGIAAERVRAAFEAASNAPESLGIPATVSAGVASGLADVAVDHLIARADSFLYQAKAKGRNRVERDDTLVTPAVPRPDAGRCDIRRPVAAALPGIQGVVSLSAPMPAR